jgi:DNA-binding response OmpR family regulator
MEAASDAELLRAGPLEVRPEESLALAQGRPLTLSVREFELLVELARRSGRIISREALYELVWRDHLRPGDRSVDVYVHKLRAKLEDVLPEWRFIHTHVGFGYRFSSEPSHAFHIPSTAP